ncbi:MAG: TolC family protein [Candidatus Cryptobacteroides sp.]
MLIQSIAILATLVTAPSEAQVLTLEQALEIALSENVAVKVADKEIERAEYAKKGTYAALFPQIDGSASFQRTIEKQVMYMDFDMSSIMGPGAGGSQEGEGSESSKKNDGMEVGRWNSFSAGISAGMPLVNFQVWESLRISGQDVELAVEKARSSRLEMVTQVKSAYYAALLAKESYKVYKEVYDNALANFEKISLKREAQKASELDYARAATTLANAVPNLYDSQNAVTLTLWQLKAVMGVDLDMEIDVAGELADYAQDMSILFSEDQLTLDNNSTMRQLAIQAEQLASAVKSQQYAYLPSLNLSFVYNYSAMANDFEFSTYNWTPYSYVGLSLSIPIFSGGKRLNNVRASKVQASELELQTENTRRQLQISIRQNINTMETAMHSYEAAGKALESAEKAYDITQASYEVGSSTLTDLNDAQLALVQARMSVSQSIFSYLNAKASLEQTLGCDFLE